MPTNTTIPTLDGEGAIPAYVARPAGTPRAAIIVYQEIFGVNPGICKKADDWAALGYLAVAPDVFWRQKPGIELDADMPEQLQEAFGYMQAHDFFKGIQGNRGTTGRQVITDTKTVVEVCTINGEVVLTIVTATH